MTSIPSVHPHADEYRKDRTPFLEQATGLGLTEDDLQTIYRIMLLSRTIDDRLFILNRQGKVAFVISGQGHEACQVGSAYALRSPEHWIVPYYRDLAVVLLRGIAPRDVFLASFGKEGDPFSNGRQMPSHYSSRERKIVSVSSPVITQLLHATGVALASKIKRDHAVTITYFGEGSAAEGDFHEALNFAGIHKLPVIFFCENNGYAISVPSRKEMASSHLADRGAAYNIPGVLVDGNDPLAVYAATVKARDRALAGEGPTLIEATCYRLVPHSSDDDDRRYRNREEVEEARRNDPLLTFKKHLLDSGVIDEDADRRLLLSIQQEVDDALVEAQAAAYPKPEDILRHVYYEAPGSAAPDTSLVGKIALERVMATEVR